MLTVRLDEETEQYLADILAREKTGRSELVRRLIREQRLSTQAGKPISEVFECFPLLPQDFSRIAELNAQYTDLPGDFADLSLVAISEQLNISAVATLD